MPLVLTAALAFVVQNGLSSLRIVLNNTFEQRVIFDLRAELFRHMQMLGLKTYDRMGVGRLMSRIQNDVTVLEDFLSTGMISVLSDILTLVGYSHDQGLAGRRYRIDQLFAPETLDVVRV